MSLGEPYFSSSYLLPRKTYELSSVGVSGLQGRTQAPFEIVVVHWLAEVANNSFL